MFLFCGTRRLVSHVYFVEDTRKERKNNSAESAESQILTCQRPRFYGERNSDYSAKQLLYDYK